MVDNERLRISKEEIKLKGSQLVDKVKEVVEEGNARRISIRKDDRILLTFPLTVGVGGAAAALLFTPVLAAVGALAALVTDVEIVIERQDETVVEIEDVSDSK